MAKATKEKASEAKGELAEALMAHLTDTGTPQGVLKRIENWLQTDGEGATAEDLYRHMEATFVGKSGTLRKAGKFCFGPAFEPESVVMQAPADELLRLREENERLKASNQNLAADKLAFMNQNTHLHQRVKDLQSQVMYLKIGKSKEDLEAAGVTGDSPAV